MSIKDKQIEFLIPKNYSNGASVVRIIGKGKVAYVWIGQGEEFVCVLEHPVTLRKIANAILTAIGSEGKE